MCRATATHTAPRPEVPCQPQIFSAAQSGLDIRARIWKEWWVGRHLIIPGATSHPILTASRTSHGTHMLEVDRPESAHSANESPPGRSLWPDTDEMIVWPDPSPLDAWWEQVVHPAPHLPTSPADDAPRGYMQTSGNNQTFFEMVSVDALGSAATTPPLWCGWPDHTTWATARPDSK